MGRPRYVNTGEARFCLGDPGVEGRAIGDDLNLCIGTVSNL